MDGQKEKTKTRWMVGWWVVDRDQKMNDWVDIYIYIYIGWLEEKTWMGAWIEKKDGLMDTRKNGWWDGWMDWNFF